VKVLSFSRTRGIFFRWTGTKFVRSLSLADWLQRFLSLAVPSSKPSGPSVSSSGIYAEAGPDVRVDFINAGYRILGHRTGSFPISAAQLSPDGVVPGARNRPPSIGGNRASRFSLFVGKVRSKAPALAEMRECGLLGQDPVRPGHVGQSSALYFTQRLKISRKISSSGRLSASIDL
jgi:hypothetical protein